MTLGLITFNGKIVKSTMENDLLSIENLSIEYVTRDRRVKAVKNVTLNVNRGEVVALVGESGSGKTTLALAIPKLLPPYAKITSGKIFYKKINLLDLDEREMVKIRGREIAMIFQDPASYLNPLLKVGDQIAEVLILHESIRKEEARRKAVDIIRSVRIPDPDRVYHFYPHQLSGGMAQRIGIAIAIACNPSFLIADEPTSALDLTIQSQILHLLKNLNKELNLAILLITHDLGIVAGVADRVAVMYAGQIVEKADVFSIYRDAKHPYTQALLSASRYSINSEAKKIKDLSLNVLSCGSCCSFYPRCPYSTEKCKLREPPEIKLKGQRMVTCWLYEGKA